MTVGIVNPRLFTHVSGHIVTSSILFTKSDLQSTCSIPFLWWRLSSSVPQWLITLDDGTSMSLPSTSITLNNVNLGVHTYSVTSPPDYSMSSNSNSVIVNENTNPIVINFVKTT